MTDSNTKYFEMDHVESRDSPQNTYSTSESWSHAASHYAVQMAAATSQAADGLIDMVESRLPISTNSSHVLDSGAGNGVLTQALVSRFPGTRILAADIAPAMLADLDAKSLPNVSTLAMDACIENHEKLPADAFSHVLSTFMIQFTDGPKQALREMHRVLKPGGVIGLGSWIDIAINWPWEEACRRLDPHCVPESPFGKSAWKGKPDVERALEEAGFADSQSQRLRVCLRFEGPEEFVGYWYEAKNPGMLKMQSAWKGDIEEVRQSLEDVVREKYGGGREFWLEAVLTVAEKRS